MTYLIRTSRRVTPEKAVLPTQLAQMNVDRLDLLNLLTPALAIYPDLVDSNIDATIRLLDGNIQRWQPHAKTPKLESTMRQLCFRGVTRFKSATTLEMLTACQAGAVEVLMSYPSFGPRARRVQEIATLYPRTRICATVENLDQVSQWRKTSVPLYIDINSGMNRTGIEESRVEDIVALAEGIRKEGIEFAGLHYYDGHHRQPNLEERKIAAYSGYEQILDLVRALRAKNVPLEVLITSGTPALPCALSYPGFAAEHIVHRISPGTIVYNDLTSLSQVPEEWGYQLAAMVIATVVSHPAKGLITCDAGHKAVSSDAGIPNCAVLGHPDLEPLHPSEEHLPLRVPNGVQVPAIGEFLFLVPRHICTTVNNFSEALLVREGKIREVVKVTARGRESPVMSAPQEKSA